MSALRATEVADVQEAVGSGQALRAVGGRTKPALHGRREEVQLLDVSALAGVVDYDPAELVLVVQAATRLDQVDRLLAEAGQWLPFDPPFVRAGATIGGAVAAGVSGPGALGGGIRDFVIGVRFVDGDGRLVRGGGRVVKNAAGFDLPKLLVGSLGRLGVIVELSLKVFPRPLATTTVTLQANGLGAGLRAVHKLARGPVSILALDLMPSGRIAARIGGEPRMLAARANRLGRLVGLAVQTSSADDQDDWSRAAEFEWMGPNLRLVAVPLRGDEVLGLDEELDGAGVERRYGLAAKVAWVGWPQARPCEELDWLLSTRGLAGVVVTGSPLGEPVLGSATGGAFAARVTRALDPRNAFAGTPQ